MLRQKANRFYNMHSTSLTYHHQQDLLTSNYILARAASLDASNLRLAVLAKESNSI